MDEYISREAAIDKMRSLKSRFRAKNDWGNGYDTAIAEAFEHIKRVPVADVQPVRHGKWDSWGRDTAYNKFYRCSCCNYEISMDVESRELDDSLPKYCLNCGARMGQEE